MSKRSRIFFIKFFIHFPSFLDFDQMGTTEFAGRVSDYLHSIDDKKTANHVKATIIKLMADNSPWENVAQNTQTAV